MAGMMENIMGLAILGIGAYVVVYYVLPQLGNLNLSLPQVQAQPYAYADPYGYGLDPLSQFMIDELEEQIKDLEDAEKDEEKKSKSSSKDEDEDSGDLFKQTAAQKAAYERQKKRHDDFLKATDPKKDTRSKAELEAAQRRAGLLPSRYTNARSRFTQNSNPYYIWDNGNFY